MSSWKERYESDVATVKTNATPHEIAKKMADYAVGCVVVVDDEERPLGMLTDRDLTCRVIARNLSFEDTAAGDVMTKPLITATSEQPIEAIIDQMRAHSVRRVPVVKGEALVGIVALDDLVTWIARQLDDLTEATRREVMGARSRASRNLRRENLEAKLGELREDIERAGEQALGFVGREMESLRERVARLLRSDEDTKS